jgi:hypothetical protein
MNVNQVQGGPLDPQQQLTAYHVVLGRIGFNIQAQDTLNQHGFSGMFNMLIYSKEQKTTSILSQSVWNRNNC